MVEEFHVEHALMEEREWVVREIAVAMDRIAEWVRQITVGHVGFALNQIGKVWSAVVLPELKEFEDFTDLLGLLEYDGHRVLDFIRLVFRCEDVVDPFIDIWHVFFDEHVLRKSWTLRGVAGVVVVARWILIGGVVLCFPCSLAPLVLLLLGTWNRLQCNVRLESNQDWRVFSDVVVLVWWTEFKV